MSGGLCFGSVLNFKKNKRLAVCVLAPGRAAGARARDDISIRGAVHVTAEERQWLFERTQTHIATKQVRGA